MSTLRAPQPNLAELAELPRPTPKRRNRQIWAWIVGIWVLSGIFIVPADQQAVVTRFGAVANPRVSPGIHYALPWPIDNVYKLKVHQLRRTVIGGEVPDRVLGRLQPALSEFLSGDQNLLSVRVVVQYSVREPKDFLFQAEDVDQVVKAAVESELSRRIARTSVDDILTTEKIAIQNGVLQAAQQSIDGYRVGVVISGINIENVTPPAETADAFRAVAGARADAIRIVNEAEGYANDLVPRARGEAAQMVEQGLAYKENKINRASGDETRFDAIATEYSKAPKVTTTRAYVEAMEQVLPKLKKLIVDSNGNLDLTVIQRNENSETNHYGADQK